MCWTESLSKHWAQKDSLGHVALPAAQAPLNPVSLDIQNSCFFLFPFFIFHFSFCSKVIHTHEGGRGDSLFFILRKLCVTLQRRYLHLQSLKTSCLIDFLCSWVYSSWPTWEAIPHGGVEVVGRPLSHSGTWVTPCPQSLVWAGNMGVGMDFWGTEISLNFMQAFKGSHTFFFPPPTPPPRVYWTSWK